jgi:4-hydroxyphenylpyruvate dioxygenase
MCLDTYQTLAQVWADCTSESGIRKNADQGLQKDLDDFVRSVPLEKVYYVQLADAPKPSPPMGPTHEWWNPAMKPNMIWSWNSRLFPFEDGYLPVMKMLETWLFNWGYRGWVSMELFNR